MANQEFDDFAFDAPTGGDDLFDDNTEDNADDWFDQKANVDESKPVLETTNNDFEEEEEEEEQEAFDATIEEPAVAVADPLDAAFEKAYEAKQMDEVCATEEEAEEKDDVKRSSIHQRYLEEKEDVMSKLKEQQAKTAAEAEAAAAEAAAQLAAEQKAAAEKKAEADKLEQFLKEKVEKAKADEEARKAAKAAKAAAAKEEAERKAAKEAAAKKAADAAKAAEAKVNAEKKAKLMAEKKAKEKAAAEKVAAERAAAAKVVAEKRAAKEAALAAEKEAAKARKEEIKARMTPVKASPRRTPAKGKKENLSPLKRDRTDTPSSAAKKSGKKAKTTGSVTPFKLTVPNSPKFAAGRKKVEHTKTTEELELESIQEKQAKLREQRAARRANMAKAQAGAAPTVAKSAKPLTEPKEFKFHGKQTTEDQKDKLFGQFTSMAECVSAFETKTPTRFRSKAKAAAPSPVVQMDASKLTQPESPAFMSDRRIKGVSQYKTREEQEEEMMKEFEANPFKATPINIDASAGCVGVRQIEKVALTQAQSPKFRTDQRGEARKHQLDDKPESPKPFKASKIAPEVLAGPKMTKLKVKEVTVPVSPELHSARRHRDVPVTEVEVKPFKAQPIPAAVAGPAKAVTVQSKPLTEPKPFNLLGNAKHEQAQAAFKAMLAQKEKEEEKARQFKANPINANVPNFVATPMTAPTMTEPKPFNLQSEKLHQSKKAEWERQLEAELEEERAQFSSFRAKPATVLEASPFVAKKSNKALTEITEFALNSDKRAEKRAEFDADIATKQRELDLKKQAEEEEKARAEKEEISLMRRTQMSFKANPIRHYEHKTIATATKELTTPYSPQLATKSRLGAR